MVKNSNISWTNHTFNPWVGCTRVSPACDFCYAEQWARQSGHPELWDGERRRTKTWGDPVKWNKEAGITGERARVFCASLADVFDNQIEPQWRTDLFNLIRRCENLDWLLLSKRPQNMEKMLPEDWGNGYPNVWLGSTVENLKEAERRIPVLRATPARIHFLSCEPLLEDISGIDFEGIDWVICGGESGPKRRPFDIRWAEALHAQCVADGTAYYFKQDSALKPGQRGRASDELWAAKDLPKAA